jgi:hypothetical protein
MKYTTQADSDGNYRVNRRFRKGMPSLQHSVRLKACSGITPRKPQWCGFTVGISTSLLHLEEETFPFRLC